MIVVTGGTGLLGSHLLIELTRGNTPVRALFRNKEKIVLVRKVFNFYLGTTADDHYKRIEWIEGDILDIPSLEVAFEGAETVYHCAGFVSFARQDYFKCMKINREGTANVVNVCLEKGVKTLCHVSSTAAINGRPNEVTTEETRWKQSATTGAYSISKYSAEKEVWRGVEEGLDCLIVNPCVIFGAGNWNEGSMAICRTIANGLRFYPPGSNAIVDARDVAEVMVGLVNSPIRNERFICVGENLSFKSLFDLIALQLGKKAPSIPTPRWLMGITWRIAALLALLRGKRPVVTRNTAHHAFSHMRYDNSKVCKALDFKFRSAEEAVRNAVEGRME